ncbi:hypothetical protein V3C99_018668 [Haemonchus contortus]
MMPHDKPRPRRFSVTATSLDAFVSQLCVLRRFRGKMIRSPSCVKSNDEDHSPLSYDSPISYFTRDNYDHETSTPSSNRHRQGLHLDLSPILESDSSMSEPSSKPIEGIPPSPRGSKTPRSSERSRVALPAISLKSESEFSPSSLCIPGRDGDGSYLQKLEAGITFIFFSFS